MKDVLAAPRTALVVDGDPTFAPSLRNDLAAHGFEVESAQTPEEAISRVNAAAPDMVVLDLYLADGGALRLLRHWKVAAPELVVILVSGHASLLVVVDALKEGARKFFTKPVSAAALLDELAARRGAREPTVNHQLGTAALHAEGVDCFFAISPGLLSVSGFDGYFKMLNPAWETTLGFSVDELCAAPHLELVHPDDREKATDEAIEMRGSNAVFRFKNRYRHRDGSYRWLAWSATPAPEESLIYASARDVTNSMRMEAGLRQSNELLKRVMSSRELVARQTRVDNDTLVELGRYKDEVAAMIVHDMKSPLAVIVSNYDYVLAAFEGPADCLEALQDSQDAGRRMLRLLANLADVTRLETGTLDVSPSPVSLSDLVRRVAEQRRVLTRARQIDLVLVETPHLDATLDVDLVTRTLENVFDNALRYTPQGGTIEVDLRTVGSDAEISIGNSGPAIPLAARETVFEKHGREGARAGRTNLGLGLYFCRLATEAQHGTIQIDESDRLPAIFKIRLPLSPTRSP